MHCTLLIPDLMPPPELGAEVSAGLRAPGFSTALARGNAVKSTNVPREDWLCERFGIARQHDRPLAALMLKADGGDPDQHYWFCAEPIAVRIDRDRMIVAERIEDYEAEESAQLIGALNGHFNADGIHLVAATPRHWYLRATGTPDISTTPLTDVVNRSVNHHLPQGAEALSWHRIMNEAQMILHAHPVNQAREARGATFANSLWLWGGGTLTQASQRPFTATWGGNHVLSAIATAARVKQHDLPAAAGSWLDNANDEPHLIVLDAPGDALRAGDVAAWRESIEAADANWMQPLLAALRSRRLEALSLVACNRHNLVTAHVTRPLLWRFWRPVRPLASSSGDA